MGDLAADRPSWWHWAYLGLWQSSSQLQMISPTLARWHWAYLGSAMLKPAKSLIMPLVGGRMLYSDAWSLGLYIPSLCDRVMLTQWKSNSYAFESADQLCVSLDDLRHGWLHPGYQALALSCFPAGNHQHAVSLAHTRTYCFTGGGLSAGLHWNTKADQK